MTLHVPPAHLLRETLSAIGPIDEAAEAEAQRRLDGKTKPRGSLGRLEELARRIAGIRGTADLPMPRKAIVVMGADHGVAADGVSAFPQAVTAQMLLNFAAGGAAINVLAAQAGAEVTVVDMGVVDPTPLSGEDSILDRRIGAGTANLATEPAMTHDQVEAALAAGIGVADQLIGEGIDLIGIGEMGIGNTTPAAALTCAFTGLGPVEATGRGTGIDDDRLRHKVAVIERALALHRPELGAEPEAIEVLRRLGGFEIAGLAGVVLGAAAKRVPVLVDGFIASAAALCAIRIGPAAAAYLLSSHRSVEAGHRAVLKALGNEPLLDLGLRLGEGTGSALAMNLVDAAVRVLRDMATFESAGVSDSGA